MLFVLLIISSNLHPFLFFFDPNNKRISDYSAANLVADYFEKRLFSSFINFISSNPLSNIPEPIYHTEVSFAISKLNTFAAPGPDFCLSFKMANSYVSFINLLFYLYFCLDANPGF